MNDRTPKTPAPIRHSDPVALRELYWQNVVAQMLSTLSVFSITEPPEDKPEDEETIEPNEMLDGRFAVVTTTGTRIPIAEVNPLFACSINSAPAEVRQLAHDVQCSIFRIRTPTGEMYTLPIQAFAAGHTKQGFNDRTANPGSGRFSGNPKAIATTGDFNIEAAFDLTQMFVKLAAEIGKAAIIGGLQD